jgi:translation initiation factor SUI1
MAGAAEPEETETDADLSLSPDVGNGNGNKSKLEHATRSNRQRKMETTSFNLSDLDALDEIKVGKIHVRTQQMGRKWVTTLEGLDTDLDQKRIAKAMQRDLHCAAKVSTTKEETEVITLQGDQRDVLTEWLVTNMVLTEKEGKERLVIH